MYHCKAGSLTVGKIDGMCKLTKQLTVVFVNSLLSHHRDNHLYTVYNMSCALCSPGASTCGLCNRTRVHPLSLHEPPSPRSTLPAGMWASAGPLLQLTLCSTYLLTCVAIYRGVMRNTLPGFTKYLSITVRKMFREFLFIININT